MKKSLLIGLFLSFANLLLAKQYQAAIVPFTTNTLDLQKLKLGTYFLQVLDQQGKVLLNDKFVKIR
jgi:hypothetical protein